MIQIKNKPNYTDVINFLDRLKVDRNNGLSSGFSISMDYTRDIARYNMMNSEIHNNATIFVYASVKDPLRPSAKKGSYSFVIKVCPEHISGLRNAIEIYSTQGESDSQANTLVDKIEKLYEWQKKFKKRQSEESATKRILNFF